MSFERFRRGRSGLCALVCALAFLFTVVDQGRAGESRPKLLMLPILVHSSEDPQYLRDGLADMLSARFSRIGALELVRPLKPHQGTTDFAKALELGKKAGADFVLFGSFTRFGKGASLDVQCLATDENTTHQPLREIFVHSGSIGEIIPDLDELAGKVSRFASGELLPPTSPASPDFAPPASSESVQELVDRIEALEAALTQILEAEEDIAAGVETDLDERAEQLR